MTPQELKNSITDLMALRLERLDAAASEVEPRGAKTAQSGNSKCAGFGIMS